MQRVRQLPDVLPENGDPAVIKPRLYLDAERFDAASGKRFLLTSSGQVEATAGGGAEAAVPTLVALLNAAEGLPLRLE